jgi:hypothetical protein
LSLDEVSGGQLRKLLERNVPPELFAPISDDELLAAYQDQFGIGESSGEEPVETPVDAESLTSDDIWRHPEYVKIRETPKDDFLAASDPGLHADLASHLSRVRSIDVLRETRALRGFTRVRDGELKLTEGKAMLRRASLTPAQDWLPPMWSRVKESTSNSMGHACSLGGACGGSGTRPADHRSLRISGKPARVAGADD